MYYTCLNHLDTDTTAAFKRGKPKTTEVRFLYTKIYLVGYLCL